jgi:hypothetical protein
MVNMLHVQGTLVPTKSKVVPAGIAAIIRMALDNHGFIGSVSDHLQNSQSVIIAAISEAGKETPPSSVTEAGIKEAAVLTFIEALEELLAIEKIKELGLNGAFIVTVAFNSEPKMILVTVENQGVFYQDAYIVYSGASIQ